MFGWFDRKHLGWLARFMKRVPVFPIPGSGRYMRQPLYALDFCDVIVACLRSRREGAWNISGLEKLDYIDLMRAVKRATGAGTPTVRIPCGLFRLQIGRAHVRTPVTNAHPVCRLLLANKYNDLRNL